MAKIAKLMHKTVYTTLLITDMNNVNFKINNVK